MNLKESLVGEKSEEAAVSAKKLAGLLKEVNSSGLDDKAQETWTKLSDSMETNLKEIADTREIGAMRKAFDPLSEAFAKVMMGFRHAMKDPLFCTTVRWLPMSRGLIGSNRVRMYKNPYFGETPYKGPRHAQVR